MTENQISNILSTLNLFKEDPNFNIIYYIDTIENLQKLHRYKKLSNRPKKYLNFTSTVSGEHISEYKQLQVFLNDDKVTFTYYYKIKIDEPITPITPDFIIHSNTVTILFSEIEQNSKNLFNVQYEDTKNKIYFDFFIDATSFINFLKENLK
jgi:hypothetical protein